MTITTIENNFIVIPNAKRDFEIIKGGKKSTYLPIKTN
jgi:hypothetical protein